MNFHLITREQFEKVRLLLEGRAKKTRPRIHDLYDILCAILYREHAGISWRSMPDVFPPWRTIHEYETLWTMPTRDGSQPLLVQVKALLGVTS